MVSSDSEIFWYVHRAEQMPGARRFCHLHSQPHLPVPQQRQRGSERNLAAIDDCANYRIEDIHPVLIQRTEQAVEREGIDRRSNTVDLDRPRLGWRRTNLRSLTTEVNLFGGFE